MKNVTFFLSLFIVFLLIVSIGFSAQELTVEFNHLAHEGKELSLEMKFHGAISSDTIDAIQNGITARFYVIVQVTKNGGIFGIGSGVVSEATHAYTIAYDVWENNFIVRDRLKKKVYRTSAPSNITVIIEQSMSPLMFTLKGVGNNTKLVLRAKIKIQTIKLYPPFGIFLYFFDPWNYESRWIYTDVFTLNKL